MKKAIGYIRISTKDQSNFSLEGQEKLIRDYCEKQDFSLLAFFEDEGQSGKNFDRVNWKLLAAFVKKNHRDVDYLIVSKYDRFSRNVSEALQMIEELEKKYDIRVMSVMENIGLHPLSPYFFQFRTQMLVGAQVELMVIKDRTKHGIHTANKNGRWVNGAPLGYKLVKGDKKNKVQGHLVIDEIKSPFIKLAFEYCLTGMPKEEIRRFLLQNGIRVLGNSGIQRILNNPLYMVMIKVNSYYDEPEQLVKGIHEPIIDEAKWWKCQALLQGAKGRKHITYNEEVPLRGALRCYCQALLTAGNSKGRHGTYYWYYNCQVHREHNLNATRLHAQFQELLKELSIPKFMIDYLQEQVLLNIKVLMADSHKEFESIRLQLKEVSANIDSIEEKYISNNLDKEAYYKWKARLVQQQSMLSERLTVLQLPIGDVQERYNIFFSQMLDINTLFQKKTIAGKHEFISVVFDNKLYYKDGVYRTPYLLPIFQRKALILKERNLLIFETPDQNLLNLNLVPRAGIEPASPQ